MTTNKDTYSFEPVPTTVPSAPLAEAVLRHDATEVEQEERPSDTAIMVGCGTLGMIVGGPFLALLTALGGRWAADKKSPLGDSTRAIGRIAAFTGKKAREEHLWCKVKSAVGSLFQRNNNCDCNVCKNQSANAAH